MKELKIDEENNVWLKLTTFIHGALHSRYILVEHEGRVKDLNDWTEISAYDITLFGENALKVPIQSY